MYGLGSEKVIFKSMFWFLCKSSMKVIFIPVPAPKHKGPLPPLSTHSTISIYYRVTEHCVAFICRHTNVTATPNSPWNFSEKWNFLICLWINAQCSTSVADAFNIEEINDFNINHLIVGKFSTPIFTNISSLSCGGDNKPTYGAGRPPVNRGYPNTWRWKKRNMVPITTESFH